MADIFELQRQVKSIEGQQERIRETVFRARMKLNDLERRKRLLKRRIERLLRSVERISGQSVPTSIVRKVEQSINDEGWMERIIERRFDSESPHGPGSGKWAPLAKSTIARRGSSHPILRDTFVLFENAVQAVSGTFQFRGVKWNVGDVPVSYAEFLQEGTDNMPARPFFNSPNAREMKPVMARAKSLIRQELRRLARSA